MSPLCGRTAPYHKPNFGGNQCAFFVKGNACANGLCPKENLTWEHRAAEIENPGRNMRQHRWGGGRRVSVVVAIAKSRPGFLERSYPKCTLSPTQCQTPPAPKGLPLLDPLSLIQRKRREHRSSNGHQRRTLPPVESKAGQRWKHQWKASVTRQWQKHCNLTACNLPGRLRVAVSGVWKQR